MMSNGKDFLSMTPAQRDAEAKKWERGHSFEETRPMSKRSQALWELAKRGRGRPRKPAEAHARRVLISLDPELLALAEAFASTRGLDRSKLFALSLQAFMAADTAHQAAAAAAQRSRRMPGPIKKIPTTAASR
jgi:hypothetical protein